MAIVFPMSRFPFIVGLMVGWGPQLRPDTRDVDPSLDRRYTLRNSMVVE